MEKHADDIQKVIEEKAPGVIQNEEHRKLVVEKVGEVVHNEAVHKKVDELSKKLEEKKKDRDCCCSIF